MIEVAFRNLLTADPFVSALALGGVHFIIRPQDERRACIVLSLVSAIPGYTFQGRGGYVNGRMQVTCLAPSYPAAKSLAQAARDALDGFNGVQDGTVIAYIETENYRDLAVMPLQGGAVPASFGVIIDARFMVKE